MLNVDFFSVVVVWLKNALDVYGKLLQTRRASPLLLIGVIKLMIVDRREHC